MTTAVKVKGVYALKGFGNGVLAAYSGREFGRERRHEFYRALGIPPADIAELGQVHSANIVRVTRQEIPGTACKADGMITDVPGVALTIRTADCIPVFMVDPVHGVAGLAHAGWRGIHLNIAGKMVLAFQQNFGTRPEDLKVAFGPGIRKKHFEVGAEFRKFFPDYFEPIKGAEEVDHGAGRLDLTGVLTDQLLKKGLQASHIHDTGLCSYARNNRFFSHRRENGTPERTISVLMLRP